ncbi:MAG TPA: acyltransferase family protein, partial [Puia sp.]|nr:acyltransferase family protein [Puia sp.]
MVQSQTYISNLTPLRGIAALWVFFFHFQGLIATFIHSNTTHLVELGYLMVDLFFIMSGFIILHVYGDKFSKVIARK